jgi:subtilisin family serine protease
MKTLSLFVSALALSATAAAQTEPFEYEQRDGSWWRTEPWGETFQVDPEVISVLLDESVADLADFVARVQAAGDPAAETIAALEPLRRNVLGIYDLRIPAGSDVLAVVAAVRATGLVQFAEENTIGAYVNTPNDSSFGSQWSKVNTGQSGGTPDADLDLDQAWDITGGEPSVVVAVLDSGTENTHNDLSAIIWNNPGEIPGNGVDDDSNGYVDDVFGWDFENNNNGVPGPFFHGTFVASIVAARTNNGIGIAGTAGGGFGNGDGCRMLIGGVGGFGPLGSVLDDAILYSADNGARVITMSLTVGTSSAIDMAVDYARNTADVYVDCAAGNSGSFVSYPANNPNVTAIGSTNRNDGVSSFSGRGPEVWVVAPGESVLGCDLGNAYTTSSGTSFAAPHVAGVAALLISVLPGLTPDEIDQILKDTAEDLGTPGFDIAAGWGRVNAFTAVELAAMSDCNGNGIYDPTDAAVTIYCQGKLNSVGCVPFLTTAGAPSVTAGQFRIMGNDMVPNEAAFMIYSGGKANLNFHGGKLCLKAPLNRVLPPKAASTSGTPPCSGTFLRNFNNVIQNGSDPTLTVGRNIKVQMYQRDPADPAGFGDSLTDAVSFTILP